MKKRLSTAAICAAVVLGLTGCGKNETSLLTDGTTSTGTSTASTSSTGSAASTASTSSTSSSTSASSTTSSTSSKTESSTPQSSSSSTTEESRPEESSIPEISHYSDGFSWDDYSVFGYYAVGITAYEGTDKDVVIPAEIDGKPVVSVAGFSGTDITSVTIPAGVTALLFDAFSECTKLVNVTFLGDTPDFRLSTFNNTPWLEKNLEQNTDPRFLIIGNALVQADSESVSGVVVVPDSVKRICSKAFLDCNMITRVAIPDSVKDIGVSAFENCGRLLSVRLPAGLTQIAPDTFYNCVSLGHIVVPEGVTDIGENAFNFCYSLKADLPDSLLYCYCRLDNAKFKGVEYKFGISDNGVTLADAINQNRLEKEDANS